jgi:uncharacterized protein (DUF58 family)
MRPDEWRRDQPAWSPIDIRRLEILSSKFVTSIFAGEYRSVFRGRGIEFDAVRDYQPGDDVRSIDWNVTARAGRPFVKQFIEERELTVILLLDVSASLRCTAAHGSKSRAAAEIVALLAFAAARSNDRVGLLTFTDRVERYIPPAKGSRHVQQLIAEGLQQAPIGSGTDLAGALNYLNRVQRRNAILFLVSDFLTDDFLLPLGAAARRHDVVAITVTDPMDRQLPSVGLAEVMDAESGKSRLIDTDNAKVRQAYGHHAAQRSGALKQTFAAAGVEYLSVDTSASPAQCLAGFFLNRQRRLSR